MARKVVRRLKRPTFSVTSAVTHQPGEELADDGTSLPDASFQVDLAIEDGTPDEGALYLVAWELTRDVYDTSGTVKYGVGGQYEAGSAFTPDICYREVPVPAGASLLTYP